MLILVSERQNLDMHVDSTDGWVVEKRIWVDWAAGGI
jgi:hypothetical protein